MSVDGIMAGLERIRITKERELCRLFNADTRFATAAMLLLDEAYESVTARLANYASVTDHRGKQHDSTDVVQDLSDDIRHLGKTIFGIDWHPSTTRRAMAAKGGGA